MACVKPSPARGTVGDVQATVRSTPPLEQSLNLAYDLLKGAIDMASHRSSASHTPAATSQRAASPAAKPPTKSIPAAVAKPKPASVASARDKPPALSSIPALSYIAVYRATPLERIDMIRRGILASEAKRLFAELPIGQGAGFKALNLSTATVNKKAKLGDTLSPEESERIVGFAKLVGQLEAMIQDSGNVEKFDARAWMARWLTEPLPAFGGVRPADLVDTMEGQGLVSAALAKIQSGAYA
jgi:putative toxin-antitoxin system antitoxin component (TIGR02293 family)